MAEDDSNRRRIRFSLPDGMAMLVICMAVLLVIVGLQPLGHLILTKSPGFLLVVAIILILVISITTAFVAPLSSSLGKRIEQITAETQQLEKEIETDFFTKLVRINFKYIERYYEQTQAQANKSFALSAFAALIGLGVLVAGIIAMFNGTTTPAYVTTGAGAFSEFIAAVFFYLYNRTIQKMSQYHRKLVLTQNVGLALKIAEELPEAEKTKSRQEVITALTKDINKYLVTSGVTSRKGAIMRRTSRAH